MKVIFLLILALLATVAVASRPFSLSCTAECAAYYTCYARAAWTQQQPNCAYPSRCDCKKPFFLSDEMEESDRNAYGSFAKLLVEHLKETKSIQNNLDSSEAQREETNSDFSITCTAKCASYYVCKAKGAWKGDYSECVSPNGCDCTKFAWQKDEEESESPLFKKVKKVVSSKTQKQKSKPAEQAESDAQFIKKLKAFFKNLKNKKQKQQEPAEPEQPIEEEADQALEKLRNWFSSKFSALKKFINNKNKASSPTTESDRMLPSRCFCIRAPCNCPSLPMKRYREESDQFLSNLKKWFEGKIAAIKDALDKNKTSSDLSIVKVPIRRPKCVCFRAPCDCDKWFAEHDSAFGKLLKKLTKDGKFPAKKLVEGLKSKRLFRKVATKYLNKKQDN